MVSKPEEQEFDNLTNQQVQAADLLAGGMSQADVARAVKVRRETLWRWGRDPYFARLLKAARHDIAKARRKQTAELVDKAMKVISSSLDKGDVKAAIAIMRVAGSLDD